MIMNNNFKNMPNQFFYLCGVYSGLKNILDSCNETTAKHPDMFSDDIAKYKLLVSTIEEIIKDTPKQIKNNFGIDLNDIIGEL